MKHKKIFLGIGGFFTAVVPVLIIVTYHFNVLYRVLTGEILLMVSMAGIFRLNALTKKTVWYRRTFYVLQAERFPTNKSYRESLARNYDVVALGSSMAFFAYDFSQQEIKGLNWCEAPQRMGDSFEILKGCHSILKKNAFILINLMPFSGLNTQYTEIYDYKYYTLMPHRQKPQKYLRAFQYPLFILPKRSSMALVKMVLQNEEQGLVLVDQNKTISDVELEHDADRWISIWKRQFAIDDLSQELTEKNKNGLAVRIRVLTAMVKFCKIRDYIPLLVIPPINPVLMKRFPHDFWTNYLEPLLESQIKQNVECFDFRDDRDFNATLFANALFLNNTGRQVFTRKVTNRLKQNGLTT